MKRFVAIILAAMMMVSCFAMTSFAASDEIPVGTINFEIDTGSIDAGTDPSEIDEWTVKVRPNLTYKTETGEWEYYPGLTVNIDRLECTSPQKTIKIGDTVTLKFYASIDGRYNKDKDPDPKPEKNNFPYICSSKTKARVSASENSGLGTKSYSTQRVSYNEIKVTVKLKPLKGQYSEPENLEWKSGNTLGQATWSKPEDENCSGSYDIRLKRNDKSVVSFSNVSGTSMNFYPWMEREGDYTFEVRCVSNGNTSGKSSEWAVSDSQYIDEKHISDGTGKFDPSGTGSGGDPGTGTSGNTTQVGWVKSGNVWYYRYPDGTYRKNGWEKVSGKWYYFDASGAMKTGWVTVNGQTYYLDAAGGDMKTGWIKTSDGQWYYMNPDPSSSTQGAMLKNQFADINGKTYYFGASGAMTIGWLKIGDKFYYFNPAQNADLGAMVRNQRVDSFYLGADGAWERGK